MNNSVFKYFIVSVLIIYLVVLGWVLFFQVGSTNRDTYFVNPDDHLLPFHSTYNMLKQAFTYRFTERGGQFRYIFLTNVLGNLVLLLPWGVLAPLVFKFLNNIKAVALSAFCISLSAEVIQYTFSLGIFDIDDLMFNTFGAVVGFYLLQIAKYFFWRFYNIPLKNLGNKEFKRNNA